MAAVDGLKSSPLVPVAQEDFLDQDAPLRGQGFVCLSFLSPEEVIVQRDRFFFQRFMSAVAEDINNLLQGVEETFPDATTRESVRIIRQRHAYLSTPSIMEDEFRFFSEKKADELDKDFNESVAFRTSIRGIKVRGVYDSMPEAMRRVEAIKRFDDKHNVYVAQVGCWCPWSPNPDDITDVEYAETQLNTLMKGYRDNLATREEFYNDRKQNMLKGIFEGRSEVPRHGVDVAIMDGPAVTVSAADEGSPDAESPEGSPSSEAPEGSPDAEPTEPQAEADAEKP